MLLMEGGFQIHRTEEWLRGSSESYRALSES